MSWGQARTALYSLNIFWSFLVLALKVASMVTFFVVFKDDGITWAAGGFVLIAWAFLTMLYFMVSLCANCCSSRNKFNAVLGDWIMLGILFVFGLGIVGYQSEGLGNFITFLNAGWAQEIFDDLPGYKSYCQTAIATVIMGWWLIINILVTLIVSIVGAVSGSRKKHTRVWSKTLYQLDKPVGDGTSPYNTGMMPQQQPYQHQQPQPPMMMPVQQPDGQVIYQHVMPINVNGQMMYQPYGYPQQPEQMHASPGQQRESHQDSSYPASPHQHPVQSDLSLKQTLSDTPPIPALNNEAAPHNTWNREQHY